MLREREIRFTLLFRKTITIGGEHRVPDTMQCALLRQRRHTPRKRVSSTPQRRDRSQMPRILDRPLEPVIGRRAAPTRWRAMTASFDRAACRSPRHTPGLDATGDQDNHSEGFGGIRAPALSARHGKRGRRRTRQDQISLGQRLPVKLRISRSAPNEENLFLLPDRFRESELFRKCDPAV